MDVYEAEGMSEPRHEDCDCSEDYGPCERHCKVWAVREGASTRTADELALCLIDDLMDIARETGGLFGGELSVTGRETYDLATAGLDGSMDHRWLDDPDLSQALYDLAWQVESSSGLWITHEDGYVIAQVTGGPLFDGED